MRWFLKARYGLIEVLIAAIVVAVAMHVRSIVMLNAAIRETTLPSVRLADDLPGPVAGVYRGDYEFTKDWFTMRIPVWDKALASYKGKPGVRYLEVGAFEGRSLLWVLENVLTDPTSHATAIDIFYGDYESKYRSNIERSGLAERVTTVKAPSRVALRDLPPESYDVAYIDGSHATADVLEDAVLAWQCVKPGGLIIFDDYQWIGSLNAGHAGDRADDWPKPAIDAFCRCFAGKFEVIHNAYQLMLRKKAAT